jgi:hypothetical protein
VNDEQPTDNKLTGADTELSVKRTWGGGTFGLAALPNKTTVSPLRTDCTLAKPCLGRMIGGVVVATGAAAVVVVVVATGVVMICTNCERGERARGRDVVKRTVVVVLAVNKASPFLTKAKHQRGCRVLTPLHDLGRLIGSHPTEADRDLRPSSI